MALDSLTPDDARKIKDTIDAGEKVLSEIELLKEGLNDTVKNLAQELDIKPTIINKAIKLAYKNRTENAIEGAQQEMSDVELILHAAGKI